jgi:flavodoxin
MKTAIIYYSYGGKTRKYCENMAKELSADIYEVQTLKRKSFIAISSLNARKPFSRNQRKLRYYF